MSAILHEELYRGRSLLERLASFPVTLCGAGALGANLAENLVRSGARKITVIDKDRVEEHNLSTQPYGRADVGSQKAKILSHSLYRSTGVSIEAHCLELNADNVKRLLKGAGLVVDCFDNTASRRLVSDFCRDQHQDCLHVGLAADFAEVLWNEVYRVPQMAGADGCDYPLARNIVQLAVVTASEAILAFLASGARRNYTVTLGDLNISPFV